jgi:hypothetical protein
MPGVGTRPLRISSGTTRLTTSIGMAKPIPEFVPEGDRIAVVTPITRPLESSRGPPELNLYGRPDEKVRRPRSVSNSGKIIQNNAR